MNVPHPLYITSRLMAGYRFTDGSLLEVDDTGDYIITDAQGTVLDDTTKNGGGSGMRAGAIGWADYGEIMDDLAAFLRYDADVYDYNRSGENAEKHDEYLFGFEVAAWANAHEDELSELACYREDRRLEE